MRRIVLALTVVSALVGRAGADVPSGGILVADFGGRGASGPAAAAVLRSLWASGKVAAVPYADAAALRATSFESGGARFRDAVAATHAAFAVVGNVEALGDVIEVCMQALDVGANPVGSVCRRGARGDLGAVVSEAAHVLAPRLGADATASSAVSLDEIVPFVVSARVASFDAPGAEAALQGADPSVAAALVDVRHSLTAIAENSALPPTLRLRGAIASGDTKMMANLAASLPHGEATAGLVSLALVTAGQSVSAIGHGSDAVLARAAAALRAGHDSVAARELTPLVTHVPPDAAALALVAAQAASLDDELEGRVVVAAAKTSAPLAARLLTRAARAGRDVSSPLATLSLADVSSDRLRELSSALPADGATRARLDAELQARPTRAAAAHETPGDGHPSAKATAAAVEPTATTPTATPTATPPARKNVPPDVETLSQALLPLLTRFPALIGHPGTAIQLVGPGETTTFAPRWIDRQLLRAALVHAITSEPLVLHIAPGGAPLTLEVATALQGGKTDVTLSLHQPGEAKPQVERERVVVYGVNLVRTGVLFWLVVVGSILSALAAAAWLAFRLLRSGTVDVHVHNKLGADKETIAVLLSRSGECPVIEEHEEFERRERKRGPRTVHRRRSLAAGLTRFSGVPAGEWFVHLFGVVRRGGELVALPEGLTRTIQVDPRGSVRVDFELSNAAAEVRIQVVDGKPVRGASIIIESLPEPLTTNASGEVATLLPPGEYTVRITARGTSVRKRIPVSDTATVKLVVDLIAERNPAPVAEEHP
jgi:hypothetical protein